MSEHPSLFRGCNYIPPPMFPWPGRGKKSLCNHIPYWFMDNPPPHYPQLARAWTVCCVNKVSLTPDLELTTPALEFAHSIPLANGPLRDKITLNFSTQHRDVLMGGGGGPMLCFRYADVASLCCLFIMSHVKFKRSLCHMSLFF